ncbi:hypothetical protein GBK02_14205 [Dechloromonas sp. TW-R-39-2]|uniref:carbohydrate porin n=1 Tax=Dechloromonas sp. TW-R-39-2 TaxID=2654218 RepID=UPI00193C9453|nr:carbohydrate porin [Dechloromonas sp. TW-R-39-2]QRM20454.1 hypothetical protein GBK02_14205 [Dechloromonas sp. TW-R-39-2]
MHHHLKRTVIAAALLSALHSYAAEITTQPTSGKTGSGRKALLQRIETLEKQLGEMQQLILSQQGQPSKNTQPTEPVAGNKVVVARLNEMEARLATVETTTVLSEPKTAVKQIQVYVDADGNQYDHPVAGATPTLTYQRERVYRRQTIREEIEEALAAEKKGSIELGVSNVTTAQMALQTGGPSSRANRHTYGLSAADVTFRAKSAALNTEFFADVVGIGGSAPDQEISAINLLNSQAARLSNNQLNLREAWIRTELLNQKLGLSVGRLDLTNYFDRNVVANDETERFISDALVNNPVLGLTTNGLGFAAIYDPKSNINFKLGMQQSSTEATSLSTSLYSLAEVEYIARPLSLPEGRYRLWGRQDNSTGSNKTGAGVSFDQKLTSAVTLFGRYGSGYVGSVGGTMKFYSGGLAFQAPYTFNPLDMWGVGYAQTDLYNGNTEKLAEGFYNLRLADHLSLSFLLQYVMESKTKESYLIPGVRMKVSF